MAPRVLAYDAAMAGEDVELERSEATRILRSLSGGEDVDTERLLQIVYDMLRRLAEDFLGRERSDHTLQATALVHEAYLKLIRQDEVTWKNEAHFMAIAATAMRRILVDHARTKARDKRGGELRRVDMPADLVAGEDESIDLLSLNAALDELRENHDRQSRIVEMRFFAGLSNEAIALSLDVSERTVERDWRFARAWLTDFLRRQA